MTRCVVRTTMCSPVMRQRQRGSVYLTQGHIEALREYERDKMLVDILKDINMSIDELPKSYFSKEELRRQFGLEGEKE